MHEIEEGSLDKGCAEASDLTYLLSLRFTTHIELSTSKIILLNEIRLFAPYLVEYIFSTIDKSMQKLRLCSR